ncbi:rubrerythrin [Candidatus Vecturithrix granuli]|uniref:Rubrerythrin n=1 Tax=Vecturithrix granuli TaxID=1499967 RepID=A0A081BXS0_VECG1|nr:rubrerythrin [Candidatus Vecturithrix granuli]
MAQKQQLDIFDFAINAERDGMNFYIKATEKFDNKAVKDSFRRLAEEEGKHIQTFLNIKAKLEKSGKVDPFTIGNVDEYLETIIHDGLFPQGEAAEKRLEKVEDVASACAVAMEAEKNAILLYSELAKTAKDAEHREAFEKLAKEEKTHIVMLKQVRADNDPRYAALAFGRFF